MREVVVLAMLLAVLMAREAEAQSVWPFRTRSGSASPAFDSDFVTFPMNNRTV